jgi:CHAP domain
MTLAEKSIEIAQSQMGIVEEKGNKGKDVKKYLNSVGLDEWYSWCMAMVYWAVNEAAKSLQIANPLLKTGGVLRQWNEGKCQHVKEPQVGDIFILDFGKGLGHTGFVKSVNPISKTFTTIEGNAQSGNLENRNGGMVCSNQRKYSSCKGFIRLP